MVAHNFQQNDPDVFSVYWELVLAGNAGSHINLRSLPPGIGPTNYWIENNPHAPEKLASFAQWCSENCLGAFVLPAGVNDGGSKQLDVLSYAAFVADIDNDPVDEKVEFLETHLGPASLKIMSGGITATGAAKRHLYWRFSRAAVGSLEVRQVAEARGIVSDKVLDDRCMANPGQVVRLAGGIHIKNGVRSATAIEHCTDFEHDPMAFVRAVHALPQMEGVEKPQRNGSGARPKAYVDRSWKPTHFFDFNSAAYDPPGHVFDQEMLDRPVLRGGQGANTRHAALCRVIGHFLSRHWLGEMSHAEALNAVYDYYDRCIEKCERFNPGRVQRDFNSFYQKRLASDGPPKGEV